MESESNMNDDDLIDVKANDLTEKKILTSERLLTPPETKNEKIHKMKIPTVKRGQLYKKKPD